MKREAQGGDDAAFLGQEFLVWLWHSAETRGGLYAVGDGQHVGIALDRVLEFQDEATGVRVVVRGDAPTRAPEAREALARGMRLQRAGLVVTVGDENVNVVLDGATLDLRSVKADKPQGETAEDRHQAALTALFGLADALDRVYREYLAQRSRADYLAQDAQALLAWARSARSPQGSRREGRGSRRPDARVAAAE